MFQVACQARHPTGDALFMAPNATEKTHQCMKITISMKG